MVHAKPSLFFCIVVRMRGVIRSIFIPLEGRLSDLLQAGER